MSSKVIEIRAFWASKDPQRSTEYYNGREDVLESYGFSGVVKSDNSWMKNNNVIVLNAYHNSEILAGMKIHLDNEFELPMENSLSTECKNLGDIISLLAKGRYAEIGGVWNSKKYAGMSFPHVLARYSLAICRHLKIKTAFTFNASYTYKLSYNYGAKLLDTVGDNGWFNYPSPKYKAAIWVFHDLNELKCFYMNDQERIEYLTNNLSCTNQKEKEVLDFIINYYAKL